MRGVINKLILFLEKITTSLYSWVGQVFFCLIWLFFIPKIWVLLGLLTYIIMFIYRSIKNDWTYISKVLEYEKGLYKKGSNKFLVGLFSGLNLCLILGPLPLLLILIEEILGFLEKRKK